MPADDGLVGGILRGEDDMIVIDQDTLQGGLGFYEDGGYLTRFHGGLLADIDDIPIEDPGVDHAVTFAGEGEISMNVGRDIDIVLDVFFCQDWRATGNGADEGDFPHLRHGHEVGGKFRIRKRINQKRLIREVGCTNKVIKINIEKIGYSFQKFEAGFPFTALIHIDAAFGNVQEFGKF